MLDARTGRRLWSSGNTMTGWTHFSGLAVANFAWIFLSGSRGGLLIGILCLTFLSFRTLAGQPHKQL